MDSRYGSTRRVQKWVTLVMVALMVFTSIIPMQLGTALAQEEGSPYPFVATANADKVNMRRRPSSTSTVLERIGVGESVTVLGDEGKYYRVSYKDRTGYVVKEYIGSGNPIENAGTTVSGYPYNTTANASVKLRSRPSSSSVVLAYLSAGDTITVKGKEGRYVKADYNGTAGYVVSEYVNLLFVEAEGEANAAALTEEAQNVYVPMQKGDEGQEVRVLQNTLVELGYLTDSDVDGIYGSGTQKAVEKLQKKNDLKPTGVADQALQALVYENKPRNANGKATQVMTLPPITGATIRLNNKGDVVASLQYRLQELSYDPGEINGVYTKQTMAAVKQFQKKSGLKVDGLAGAETQNALFNSEATHANANPRPEATPLPKAPKNIVKKGDKGDDVKLVQQMLKELGYYQGEIDGVFGTGSVAALQRFQQMNALEADGIAGKTTYDKMFTVNAIGVEAPQVTLTPITKENAVVIQNGTAGEIVVRLQQRLTELGYYSARNDGTYLADDIAAVRAFQRNNGLEVDGKAGYATQVLLYSDQAISAFAADTVTIPQGENGLYATLRQGDRGDGVLALQSRLIELGYLAQGEADGRYGFKTAEAIVSFQKKHNLVRDGIAGNNTLQIVYGQEAQTVTVTEPTSSPNLLKEGDSSEAVKSMQEKLIQLGYLSGKADGVFGIQTAMALSAFQLRNGLKADKIAGSNTLGILSSGNAKPAQGTVLPQATQVPSIGNIGSVINVPFTTPKAAQVIYSNWYSSIRSKIRANPILTVYDFSTGLSWKVNAFSSGAHADGEPLTAQDTANMLKAFGGKQSWTPKAVWVVLTDGTVFMASTHSYGHEVDHTSGNNLSGHICIHFPRTQAQVQAIGSYATSHQLAIEQGWAATQNMIR